MTDIREAAQREAERTYIPRDRMPMTSELCAKQGFIDGAVWAQAQVTPTRDQIERALIGRDFIAGTDAILALLAAQAERETHEEKN